MNFRRLLTVLAVATVAVSGIANANPIIRLTSGLASATVADADGNDTCGTVGCVTFTGGLSDWIVNVTTGIGTPPLGPSPHLDLNSVNVSNSGTGSGTSITLELTQTGFTEGIGSIGGFLAEIGGTLAIGGNLEWFLFVDLGNNPFGDAITIATDKINTSPFADSGSGGAFLSGPYSMTLRVIITHPDTVRSTSFDFSGRMVPEPGTLLLIGAGLLALGLARRKLS